MHVQEDFPLLSRFYYATETGHFHESQNCAEIITNSNILLTKCTNKAWSVTQID